MTLSGGPFGESDGLVLYWNNGKCGFRKGRNSKDFEAIPCIYESAVILSGYFVALKYNGKWGVLDEKNTVSCDFIYERIEMPSPRTYVCAAMKNGKWGLIFTKGGGAATGFEYDQIRLIKITSYPRKEVNCGVGRESVDYAWALTYNGKVYAYDDWAKLIYPRGFDNIKSGFQCYNPCLLIENNQKYGLLTLKGDIIIQCIYDEILSLQAVVDRKIATFSYAATRLGNKWGIIGDNGAMLLMNQFDMIKSVGKSIALKHGSKWGILSSEDILKLERQNNE